MTTEDIERAIERLTPDELVRFRAWFEQFDAQRFDHVLEQDGSERLGDRADFEERVAVHFLIGAVVQFSVAGELSAALFLYTLECETGFAQTFEEFAIAGFIKELADAGGDAWAHFIHLQ